jgi:undecaprenyl diphosphate synthase
MVKSPETLLNIPVHVAVIPDGNRRWAKEKGLPSLVGHKKGVEKFDELYNRAREMGIKCITTWIFSTENWKRSEEEKEYLFDLARDLLKKYKQKFIKEKVRFVHLGRKDRIPEDIARALIETEEETKEFTDFTWALAMDYGGHDELIRAVESLVKEGFEVTPENIESRLDTKGLPPPDLIIRTSGEQRLSGFLSWQCAYAEFYFPKIHFPDFNGDEFEKAIKDYMNRERRFGGDTKPPTAAV